MSKFLRIRRENFIRVFILRKNSEKLLKNNCSMNNQVTCFFLFQVNSLISQIFLLKFKKISKR